MANRFNEVVVEKLSIWCIYGTLSICTLLVKEKWVLNGGTALIRL